LCAAGPSCLPASYAPETVLPPLALLCRPAPDLATAAYHRYLSTRLALCRFACQHQQTLALLLVVELALCVLWLAVWLLRSRSGQQGEEEDGADHACYYRHCHHAHRCSAGAAAHGQPQFLIATATDPQWHQQTAAELKQPLLGAGERCGSSSSLESSC